MNFIDIASWQKGIDLDAMFRKHPDLDGVIVKASGGTGYVNPDFKGWADTILAEGKMLGVYHFLDDGCGKTSGAKEAEHFVKTITPYIGRCVPFVDWEADALKYGAKYPKDFMWKVYELTGVKCGIYLSHGRISSEFSTMTDCPLWVARYADDCKVKAFVEKPFGDSDNVSPWEKPTLRQYTANGYLDGWSGRLDFNKFYGTREDWNRMAGAPCAAETQQEEPDAAEEAAAEPEEMTENAAKALILNTISMLEELVRVLKKRIGEE